MANQWLSEGSNVSIFMDSVLFVSMLITHLTFGIRVPEHLTVENLQGLVVNLFIPGEPPRRLGIMHEGLCSTRQRFLSRLQLLTCQSLYI